MPGRRPRRTRAVGILLDGFAHLADRLALQPPKEDADHVSLRAQNLARLEDDLKEPVARAADAARTPWWR
ncbi:MAG TPA: hypothetical protein VHK65_17690 [Candidatus Dormibacteraeota bacterium]|nr:hypothetical protein [Candidatus Dormibacteraeota bacterium]